MIDWSGYIKYKRIIYVRDEIANDVGYNLFDGGEGTNEDGGSWSANAG